jgi:hypothetical protein
LPRRHDSAGAGNQPLQLQRVPSVQRQTDDAFLADDLLQRAGLGVHLRRLGADDHGFLELADLHLHLQRSLIVHVEDDVPDFRGGEALA